MSIKINRVYTRSGDDGDTGLVGGKRVSKTSTRVASFGDIDELNSMLGVVKESINHQELKEVIEFLQQMLFDLGSELATPKESEYESMWKVTEEHVLTLEKLCDYYGDKLPELNSFILPGGSYSSALLHMARCVARRAERSIVALSLEESNDFNKNIFVFVNRISDLLFILARHVLFLEKKDTPLWVQEKNRKLPITL
ncbi:MAG: cob(I)yrinic acid a,c-diamide adenosyltransferase [Proteobacteria bacterium]|nr:cob(I)yrinic acid a,c-diamide adenosyltransferase [Pseudomonadota bacterium]